MRLLEVPWRDDPRGLAAELHDGVPDPPGVEAAVAETIAAVRARGDAAVLELGERFDGVRAERLRVPAERLEAALADLSPKLRAALERGAGNVRVVAEAQLEACGLPRTPALPEGQEVTVGEVPVGAAGIYAPGGRAAYPSSVLMGVIPARVAGVGRVVVASPPVAGGLPAPEVLAAARIAGASEVIATGGAQAIAALAYGTESIEPVDVIAGPGGPWVQVAKLQCARRVGIDGFAGPSELVVIADGAARADWLALDLCAQAEHGDDGLLVAIATDAGLLRELGEAIRRVAAANDSVHEATVALLRAPDVDAALALAQELAPEHLQLDCAGAAELAAGATTAGCVFAGPRSATAFGDYAAGSNHVLPTAGAGRYSGPLGPGAFRRRISRVTIGAPAATALAPTVNEIAVAEGFPVHGASALARAAGAAEQEPEAGSGSQGAEAAGPGAPDQSSSEAG